LEIPGQGKVRSVFSVTQIEAMEGSNIIPGKCTLTADYRSISGESEKKVQENISVICREVLGDSFKLSPIEQKEGYINNDSKFHQICQDAAKKAGLWPFKGFSFGWNDGQVFHNEGMKAIKMGPGTTGQDHRNPEYCWIPGLVKGTQAVLNVIRGWDRS
jgi:acetylornithine deacetylase/succinyl-diaminopimelate desuccinylase-like protein